MYHITVVNNITAFLLFIYLSRKTFLFLSLTGQALMVRYAKSITINVALQDFTTQGYIYPPSIMIEYESVSLADANSGAEVDVSYLQP